MARRLALPTFLIIGAGRSATRWLRFNLNRHPDVFLPPVPLDYFAPGVPPFEATPFEDARRTPRQGARWYGLQFADAAEVPARGECSPSYLTQANRPALVARRIEDALPDVRLLAVLRNPVDRLYSAVRHAVLAGRLPVGTDVVELLDSDAPEVAALDLVGGGCYATNLYPYRKVFGDRLAVFTVDDIEADPVAVRRQALVHIGVDPDVAPGGLDRVLFATPPLELVRPLDDEQRRRLYAHFRWEVEELQELLDHDLSAWDPGPKPFDLPVSPAS